MKKLTQLLKESQELDYRRMNVGEEDGQGMTKEEKRAFVEAVAAYRQLGEMISHKGNISEIHDSIKGIVENANNLTLKETGDWFDRVTVQRHMKSMNESFKVFSNTIKEVSTLQQRLESSYDEIGEVLGKYYEIKEGNEFGAERAKAIANGDDSFEVDGKSYKVTGVDAEDKKNADEFANESMKLTSLIKRNEELTGKQKELDVDSDGDIEADDLADLRAGKKADESVNEEEIRWNAVENAIINFLKMNTKILDKRVKDRDTEGVKGGLKSIISGLVNAQRNLKLESVNEAGYTVKAENPYQFVNGAYAVLSAYLKDEELGPKGKRELQDIIKSLDYMRKYFYFKMSESVNEAKFKVLASFGGYDLIEAPTEKDMIISKNGKKVGKLTKISKYLKDDIKSFINMVKSDKLGESVNEEKYTVIDPMGNQKGVGPKIQAISMAKRLGGEKTGHFVVANTNALKARRALEKFKGDFKNPKLKDMMMNLYYESVNERIVKEKVK